MKIDRSIAKDRTSKFFPGFEHHVIETSGAQINCVVGGEGPPLLLLHGNPLTHVSWHKTAPELAKTYTVIAADLRGYGDSSKPEGGGDHSAYSFRAQAQDMVEVMAQFGFDRFMVAGHDRGARVGFRMTLDNPGKVLALAALDIVPTHHVLTHVTKGWAQEAYHWFLMSQKAPFPEKLLGADLEYYMQYKLNKKGVGLKIFAAEAMAEYVRCCTHEQIHAVCEDYRATVGVDFDMDCQDFGKLRLDCPVLVLWGENSHCGRHFDPIPAWQEWADDVTGLAIPTGHYPAEQRPDLVLREFRSFFGKVTK